VKCTRRGGDGEFNDVVAATVVCRIMEPLPLVKGQTVYRRGDLAKEFYVVVDGQLVQRSTEGGEEDE
jgi:CRP-like cAMP-binding protein